ncbi:hypothetical protein [Rummeliibacillus pycnus]|uniref:hypothetical protein n=1 Tax=Rummeliibacillus pycnus TaxID=101070 RepID=UPI0037C8D186
MPGIVILNLFVFLMAVTMLCVVIKFYRLNKETPSYKYKFVMIMFILALLMTLVACGIIDANFT